MVLDPHPPEAGIKQAKKKVVHRPGKGKGTTTKHPPDENLSPMEYYSVRLFHRVCVHCVHILEHLIFSPHSPDKRICLRSTPGMN